MRERKLKEQFIVVAEGLRHAQLTAEQLAALHSIQYFYIHIGEQRIHAKLKTFLIGTSILLFIAACFTLSPLSQLVTILFDVCGLQVMHFLLYYKTVVVRIPGIFSFIL